MLPLGVTVFCSELVLSADLAERGGEERGWVTNSGVGMEVVTGIGCVAPLVVIGMYLTGQSLRRSPLISCFIGCIFTFWFMLFI